MYQNTQAVDPSLFTRPADLDAVTDGVYKGGIISASTYMAENKFKNNEQRPVLSVKVRLETDAGPVELSKTVTITWSKKGKMIPLLNDLKALPEPGKPLDLDALIGLPVTVIVQNVEYNEETFCKIVSIKRDKGRTVKPQPKPVDLHEIEEAFEIDEDDED